jgi:DNA-binding response OmpR family regulator
VHDKLLQIVTAKKALSARAKLRAMNAHAILIVDDDQELGAMVCDYLGQNGLLAATVPDGSAMDAWLADNKAELLILDLMLPGEDGLSIARRLSGKLPFIVLSARGDETDRIVGLELGADDYLSKPFNPRELLARIRAVLRRQTRQAEPVAPSRVYTFGAFRLDIRSHTLSRDGKNIEITTAELALLKALVEHPNRVLSRDMLASLATELGRMPFDRSIDVRIARLRKKIEDTPDNPRFIRTVWGSGYLFAPQGDHQDDTQCG